MRLTYLTYCPRSGSTKLSQMLADRCVVVPEFRTPIRLAERASGDASTPADVEAVLAADVQLEENLGFDGPARARVASLAQPGLAGVARAVVTEWAERNAIDAPSSALLKLGRLVEYIDFVLEADSSARMLFIVRDPRAVVRSMHGSRPPRGEGDLTFSHGNPYFAVRMWRRRLAAYERAAVRYRDRVAAVRFEDLGDPSELERVASFVGTVDQTIPFMVSEREQTLHTKVDRSFDVGLNRQWQDELSARTVRNIEALCRHDLSRWGYDVESPPSAPATAAAHLTAALSRPLDVSSRMSRRLRSTA